MQRAGAVLLIWAVCVLHAPIARSEQTPAGVGRAPTAATPDDVTARFARLNVAGAQLTAAGWEQIAALFTTPGLRPTYTRLDVVSNRYGLVKAVMTGERTAEARVDYTHLGFIDVSSGVFDTRNAGVHLRGDVKLVRVAGPAAATVWQIDGAVTPPNLTRTAAIRYLTERLAHASDSKLAGNLRRALASLKSVP